MIHDIVGKTMITVYACGVVLAAGAAGGDAFSPAFPFSIVDLELTRTLVDGEALDVDPNRVARTLGFDEVAPRLDRWSDRESEVWRLGAASGDAATEFGALLVLKEPVAIGSVALGAETLDHRLGDAMPPLGRLWYWRPGATDVPDPDRADFWVPVEFAPGQPFVRFAPLPPGTTTRGFLYRETRPSGEAWVRHWRFYERRLFNVMPAARVSGEFQARGADPRNLLRGGTWRSGYMPTAPSREHPIQLTVMWDQPLDIRGLFFVSDAREYELVAFAGPEDVDPGVTGDDRWKPLSVRLVKDHHHGRHRHFYRWLAVRDAPAGAAIRLNVFGASGNFGDEYNTWVAGLGAFIDLGDGPAPALTVTGEAPPPVGADFMIPMQGEASVVVNAADGTRIRYLEPRLPVVPGPTRRGWDLKDAQGEYVEPGRYTIEMLVGPPLRLTYQMTPYPNVNQRNPDRTPWLRHHNGPDGWLSDHAANQSMAVLDDRLYFSAWFCEAGVSIIETDLNGDKTWGTRWSNFAMTSDGRRLFLAQHNNELVRLDPGTREPTTLAPLRLPDRSGDLRAFAGGPSGIWLAFGNPPLIENAARPHDVEMEHVLPARIKPDVPSGDPRDYFLRTLRLTGTPPGQYAPYPPTRPPSFLPVYLDSTFGPQHDQYIVIPFKRPIELGSLMVPYPTEAEPAVEFATLNAEAVWPPNPGRHQDWTPIPHMPHYGRWTALTMPADTRTRALRIRFSQPGEAPDELFGESDEERFARPPDTQPPAHAEASVQPSPLDDPLMQSVMRDERAHWLGRLEGMKLLSRRFRDIGPEAVIRVNSGTVDAAGVWDAQRTRAIWDDDPGIYMMEWDDVQSIAALAIKEIDGDMTMIDVWQGDGPVSMTAGTVDADREASGWRHVETYQQARRNAYQPSQNMNVHAIYMDGYVDFKQPIQTRAVRLRVMRQWLHTGGGGSEARRHDGRHEHGVHYTHSHTAMLDTRICKIHGVAVLELLEDVAPTMRHQRLEVRSPETGALQREFPVNVSWNAMAIGSDGSVYYRDGGRDGVIRLNPETGARQVLIADAPDGLLAVGPRDEIVLLPWRHADHAVLVYDRDGAFQRGFGTPRREDPHGPWDPERPYMNPREMQIDGRGQVWIVEGQINLRRIVCFDLESGRLIRELFGNTQYGGAGWLHRYRGDRAYHLGAEFELDWNRQSSGVRRTLDLPGAYTAIRIDGRTYLASVAAGHFPQQSMVRIFLDDDDRAPRLVAAFGNADAFGELRQAAILAMMGEGEVPANYLFIWSDLNGNGRVDADEVQLERKSEALLKRAFSSFRLGRVDNRLGCAAEEYTYRVARFLPDGTPVYVKERTGFTGHLRLDDGNRFALHAHAAGHAGIANQVLTPDGTVRWRYPVESPGVHGLGVASWDPGRINNEFGIIGHETASAGELGEFMVVHANTGQWNIWTADGHLAGHIFQHKSRADARFFSSFETAVPGMRLDPIAMPQEAFHGNFVKLEDGRYLALAGFSEMNIVEVQGLDDYVRLRQVVEVTEEELERTREWEQNRVREDIASRSMVIEAQRVKTPIMIDGVAMDFEWPARRHRLVPHTIYFRMAYDDDYLYLCWQDEGDFGALRNTGEDFRRLFKTGAALDFMLATNPAADPDRRHPVQGDIRILIAFVKDEPRVVLYEPVAPNATAAAAWRVSTPAGGETAFDRVRLLPQARVARMTRFVETQWNEFNQTTIEARIPLRDIGLKVDPEAVYAGDWGVLLSNDGITINQRLYWANRTAAAAHTADEPTEARLEPRLWGQIRFEPYEWIDELLDNILDGGPGVDMSTGLPSL